MVESEGPQRYQPSFHPLHVSFPRVRDSLELSGLTLPLKSWRNGAALRLSIPPTCRVKSCGPSLAGMQGMEPPHIPTERKLCLLYSKTLALTIVCKDWILFK